MAELPLEYTPLSHRNLYVDMKLGPTKFTPKLSSHEKSKRLLEESDVNEETKYPTPYLFPSEMWGWARVFSSYFGRLNECAVSRATWEIHGKALPSDTLVSHSRIMDIQTRNSLPFATVETVTEDMSGNVLLRSFDELLLLHGVNKRFYKERGKEKPPPLNYSYQRARRVYHRHDWNNGNWINNIHTDEYARKFGYEQGLPEFIMYMDWIFLTQLEQYGDDAYDKRVMDIRKILPLYMGDIVYIFGQEERQKYKVQFFRGNQERLEATIRTQ